MSVDRAGLQDVLSLERLQRYIEVAEGDLDHAIALYSYNASISESLYPALQMLEIAMRNRFHTYLSAQFGESWFDEPAVITDVFQRRQIDEAKLNLVRDRKKLHAGRLVTAMSFGFWTSCLGRRYEELWRQCLRKAFVNAPHGVKRKSLNTPLTQIRLLRNRIAHHEPILRYNLPVRYSQILELTEWLSQPAAEWTRQQCRFPSVFDADIAALFRRDV